MGVTRGRAYDNSTREEAARVTRGRILDAAREMLLHPEAGGYSGMTVAALASAAEVSPQTVYNAVGGKAAVVKALYDVSLAGDDQPVAMSDRPEFRAMQDSDDRAGFLAAYAALTRGIHERVGPLVSVLVFGGSDDQTLRDFVATIEEERRTGNGHAVDMMRRSHGLKRGTTRERTIDIIWTLTSPEVADRLMRRCGWSPAAYEKWLAQQLTAALA